MRVRYVFLKYSRPNKINSGESKWHAHGRDTLWRNFARGKYENRVTAPWEIMRQYGTEVYFRLSLESDWLRSLQTMFVTKFMQGIWSTKQNTLLLFFDQFPTSLYYKTIISSIIKKN